MLKILKYALKYCQHSLTDFLISRNIQTEFNKCNLKCRQLIDAKSKKK